MPVRPADLRRQRLWLPIVSVLLLIGTTALASAVVKYKRGGAGATLKQTVTSGGLTVRLPGDWAVSTPTPGEVIAREREDERWARRLVVRLEAAPSIEHVVAAYLDDYPDAEPVGAVRVGDDPGVLFEGVGRRSMIVVAVGELSPRLFAVVQLTGPGRPRNADRYLVHAVSAGLTVADGTTVVPRRGREPQWRSGDGPVDLEKGAKPDAPPVEPPAPPPAALDASGPSSRPG
jgi:hypothetical protein